MSAVRSTYGVWRRELQVTLRAPIVYVIGGLFLAVQGIAFAGLINALSDPMKPAPLGALLEGQLAGTLLTWVLQLVVLTLLGMRTIADDKRSGAWELLLTAQVGEGAAVVGKWLAAITVYALLWVPTLLYLVVVSVFRVDNGGWDLASIATGYLGAIAIGAALLAWAVAASAATSTTLVAGALAFALLIGLFLVGELSSLWEGAPHWLASVSLRGQLTTLARGEVTGGAVVFIAGLTGTGLSLAITFACIGRRRRRELLLRLASTGLACAISVLLGVLAAQHPVRWDASATRRNSLDPATLGVLASLPGPATLTIVDPTLAALEPIYAEVARVAGLMAEHGSVTARHVDPANVPGGIEAAARIAGVMPTDLATHGGIVVEVGERRRVVDRVQLASVTRDEAGTAVVENLGIEQAIAGALARASTTVPVKACATTGHDELPLVPVPTDADWARVAERLQADGIDLATVSVDAAVPADCNVLVVAGPMRPVSPEAALHIQTFVQQGGGLLVAAASRPLAAQATGVTLATTGLEGLLATHGLGLPPAIAVDPELTVREMPGALMIVDGYSDHPINAGFAATRPTIWFQPRGVLVSRGARALVSASPASWGERDLVTAPPAKDADDLAGPVVLAAVGAGPARVLALGSAESFTTAVLEGGASANDLWLVQAVRFLAGKPAPTVTIAPRAAEQVRLVLTDTQRRTVMALCIAGIPVGWLVLGGLVLLARRRRDR